MKRRLSAFLFVVVFVGSLTSLLGTPLLAHAATYNTNNIMDDNIFDNSTSMSAGQIDSWLNSNWSQSCLSTNNSFSSPDVTGYSPSTGYTYGGNVSAGTVISHAAVAYGINPEVLIATLEKESSVVTGLASYHCQYINTSMGYDCPDAGSCPQNPGTESGFSKQIIHAAWMLRFHEQRSKGNVSWQEIHPGWNNSDDPKSCYSGRMTTGTFQNCPGGAATYYDGLYPIDGQTVHMDSGATAALYDYTPHFSGNQHFQTIFEDTFHFGSTHNPYAGASYDSQSSYPVIDSGVGVSVFIKFRNTGNTFWKDDMSNFPGWHPIHLAATFPINRQSPFVADNWPSGSRPTGIISKVYNSDGTLDSTPADQHTVQPGQIGEFDFTIYANPNIPGGVYREYFQPIVEGAAGYGWNMGGWAYLDIGVNKPSYQVTYVGESTSPTIAKGGSSNVFFKLKNTGTAPWLDDHDLTAGRRPVHLATSWPINRASIFSSGWPFVSRPNLLLSKVYQPDGVRLSSAQHTVQPGQIGEYDFTMTVPANAASGTYPEHFQPIVEGSPGNSWNFGGDVWLSVTVP